MIIIMPPKEISKHYRTNNMLRKGMIMMRSDGNNSGCSKMIMTATRIGKSSCQKIYTRVSVHCASSKTDYISELQGKNVICSITL